MKFLTKEHENQFLNLLQRDRTHPKDVERLTLFYIYQVIQSYMQRQKVSMTWYQDDKSSPIQILSGLDTDYFLLATESMRIRFGYPQQVQSTLNDEELEL